MTPETLEVLVPFFTALVGVGGTLGGVALTQRSSGKRERERAAELRSEATTTRVAAMAEAVYVLISEEHEYVDRLRKRLQTVDEWDAAYETHVYEELLAPLGRAIALIPNADARSQLFGTVRALTSGLKVNGGSGELYFWSDVILNAAKGISSAYARGETPDDDALAQLKRAVAVVPA